MTMFCTVDDLKRMFRDRDDQYVISIGDHSDADMSIEDAMRYIEAEAEYIITALGKTPAASPMVRDINAELAAYAIWIHVIIGARGGDVPEFVTAWKQRAEERLAELELKGHLQSPEAPFGTLSRRSTGIKSMELEPVVLKGYEYSRLSKNNIMQGSFGAHKEESRLNVYQPWVDYHVNYETGEIRRLQGSSIVDGQKIYVCYNYIHKSRFDPPPGSVRYRHVPFRR